MKMEKAERKEILEVISKFPTTAENELVGDKQADLADFLVMKQYAYLRDPNRFLVLGGRGSGKTKVFRTLTTPSGFQKIIGDEPHLFALRAENCDCIVGYDLDNRFPLQDILDAYAEEGKAKAYWAGSLLIVLLNKSSLGSSLRVIMQQQMGVENAERFFRMGSLKKPSTWVPYLMENPELWGSVLDNFNEELEAKDRWVIVAYDSLDRITNRYSGLFPFIRDLLSFWLAQSKRWQRLRCKIFLRNDLYQSKLLNFMDASKLSNNTIHLEWTTSALYQLLVKRIANSGSKVALRYLQLIPGLIHDQKDAVLGYLPTTNQSLLKLFINQLIGPYMGNSPKKGQSYSWVPNHLQDANGSLAPRSFIKCFALASQAMLDRVDELDEMVENRLILPSTIQDALVSVSDDRVRELQEEYPWLEQLKIAFKNLTMLMDKDAFIENIRMDLWNDQEKQSLPGNTPQELFSVLQNLGIVLIASDGRVNVPEIYLHGFRMKRKGGLQRTGENVLII